MAEDVANEFEIFEQRYNDVMAAAGTSTIEFATTVDGALTYVEEKSNEAAANAEQMADEFIDAYGRALSAAAQFSEQYASVAQSVISNNVQMIKSIGDLIRQLAAIGGPSYNGISNYVTSAITPAGISGIDKLNNEIADQVAKNNLSKDKTNLKTEQDNSQLYTIKIDGQTLVTNVTAGNLESYLRGAFVGYAGQVEVDKQGTYGKRVAESMTTYLKNYGGKGWSTGGYTGE